MHAPAQVDVEDLHELVPSLGVSIASNRGEERGDINVRSDDAVENPLNPEISDAFQSLLEGIDAGYGYRV